MLDIIFWMLFLLTPLNMFFLLRVAGEQLNQISIVNITTVSIYIFSVIGTLPLFYQLDDYRLSIGVNDQELVLKVLFYSFLNIVFFLLGVIFLRKVINAKPVPFASLEIKGISKVHFLSMLVVFFLVIFVLYMYIGQVEQVAFFVALKEGAQAAELARSKMGNDFTGKYHWYSLVMHNIGTLVALTFYISWLIKRSFIMLIMFLVSFTTVAFIAVMATEKAPFVSLLMAFFMAYYLTKLDGYVPKKHLIVLGCIVICILTVFFIYFMGSKTPIDALSHVISRAFAGSIQPAYFYFKYFPEHQEFLMGRSFPNPGGLLPFIPVRFTVDVMHFVAPHLAERGVVGSMPTVFWGEAYANFGIWGIPLIAFIMGFFVGVVSYLISKLELNPITVAFIIVTIYHFKRLSVTGFSGFIFDFYMLFVSFLVIMVLFTEAKFGIRKNRKVKHIVS